MRKTMLTLLFGGALALAAAMPSQANAHWMHGRFGMMNRWWWMNQQLALNQLGMNNIFRFGPMGSFSLSGPPTITPFAFQGFNGFAYNFPTRYQFSNRNNAVMSLLLTGGFRALAFNSNAGFLARVMTPSISGYVISPFVGFQTFNVPSSTFNIPIGNNVSNFYLSYLEANFFNP